MGLIKSANVSPASAAPFSMRDIEQHARAILLAARKQAEDLLAEAQKEVVNLRAEAHVQGFAQGKVDGLAQGLAEGTKAGHERAFADHQAQYTQLFEALQGAMTQLNVQRLELESHALDEVVQLALAVARRVTKRQAELDPGVLAENLADSLRLAVGAADVRIAIHPEQRETLNQLLPALQIEFPNLAHVEIVDDASVGVGGTRVYTRHGQIHADLDGQLARIIQELMPDA